MTKLHFVADKLPLLTWFNDSPNAGNPECLCSFCGTRIREGEMPIRIFRQKDNTELRLHMECAQQVIVEMAPQPYKDHPAFAEGRAAHAADVRRGANPHKSGVARSAWWAGWDAAWTELHHAQ